MEKKVVYIFVFVLILGFVSAFNVDFKILGNAILNQDACSDGTLYNKCSSNKEFYCDNGNLVSNCGLCGCGDGFNCENNQCVQAASCEQGNGVCSNECNNGYIEYLPLTNTCNLDENNNGNIDISNSKGIVVNVLLKNSNKFRVLENINVNVFIEDTNINDGFTLLILNPEQENQHTLKLQIPESLDRTKTYTLHTQVVYSDKTLSQDYSLSVTGGRFSLTIKNVTFADNQKVRLGDDLLTNFEIVNKKCCISNKNKAERFYGYCGTEEECNSQKPLVCRNSILLEDCTKCGCNEGFNCDPSGRCINKITSEEINKFYDLNKIDKIEQSIIGNFIKDFSEIPRSPEKPIVNISLNRVSVKIEDVNLEGSLVDNKPRINISLGK